jgi:hypothetical protein
MLLTEYITEKSTESVLLNAYTMDSVGFMRGKAGMALTLFETAVFMKNEKIENHASMLNFVKQLFYNIFYNPDY